MGTEWPSLIVISKVFHGRHHTHISGYTAGNLHTIQGDTSLLKTLRPSLFYAAEAGTRPPRGWGVGILCPVPWCRAIKWDKFLYIKGTVQRDFLSPIFSLMESSQAPYSVFKDFSTLASNSRRYSRFFIDSPQYFIAESPNSPYCLLRRVVTPRIILAGSHHLLALYA